VAQVDMSDARVVWLDDATVEIGRKRLLGPVSLSVGAGESWVVLGPNGSGKTTLLDLAGGLRHPTSGAVEILGSLVGRTDLRELRPRIGFVGHRVTEAIPARLRVEDVVLTGKRSTLVPWLQSFDEDDRGAAAALLDRVGCAHVADQPLESCSQGERQRVLLARALFGRPELLLLDEPAAGLDLRGRDLLLQALEAASDGAPPSILVTHHLEEIPRTATHAALLREGRFVAAGRIRRVLTSELVSACFGTTVPGSFVSGRWQGQPL
jgi:iron complex transport system ATP-binding protein